MYFIIPACKPYRLDGHRWRIHLSMTITDEASVSLLRNEIKYRQRSAFLKSLLRGCLISPQVGAFLKSGEAMEKENRRIQEALNGEPDYLDNISIVDFTEESRHFSKLEREEEEDAPAPDREAFLAPPIESTAMPPPRIEETTPTPIRKMRNEFGDVSDLLPNKEPVVEKEERAPKEEAAPAKKTNETQAPAPVPPKEDAVASSAAEASPEPTEVDEELMWEWLEEMEES